MLVEIPDPEVILGIVVAFFVGVFVLYLFSKLKPYIKFKQGVNDPGTLERLEYYESQLIDMKIRLDSLEIMGEVENTPEIKDYYPRTEHTPQ
ncbi:hypothetical protein LCGC14_1785090, partial [marine sediment metagenome]